MGRKLTRRGFVRTTMAAAGAGVAAGLPSVTLRAKSIDKPAILGGQPVRSAPFPAWPVIHGIDEEKVVDALRRKEWCRLYGNITTDFEEKWASALGAKFATGVVNGTNALYAALDALEVGPGDEVLVPPYTFVATINAVIQLYALPVFVDSDPETFQIDAGKLEAAVTENTRCILPVHLGGSAADMDGVMEVARRRGIGVVEDACQAHFAEWRGRRVGSIGDIGCFSFQASKIFPCGEGGALVTSREDLLNRFHAFQNNGRDRLTGTRHGYQHQGSNLRMNEFQAALLLAQLTRLEEQCTLRESNAKHLTRLLEAIPGIHPAKMYEGCTRNTYYLYMFRYDAREFADLPRARFLRALEREGIPCSAGYRPLNDEPFLEKMLSSRAYRRVFSAERLRRYRETNRCPANDQLCLDGVFMSQRLLLGTHGDVEQVAEAIARIQRHAAEIPRT